MSVFKLKGSPYFYYDFKIRGHRFYGSTREKNRRKAEIVETAEREKAKEQVKKFQRTGKAPLTMDMAAGRYWTEVGQHHAGSDTTWTNLERLLRYFGPEKLLAEITDDDVAQLVAWRRGHHAWDREDQPLVSPTTVNRSTTEMLQKLFTRAKGAWKTKFDNEPTWGEHLLPEPIERVRELHEEEARRFDDVLQDERADYEPFFAFARASGLRLKECLLKWPEVNWSAGQIQKTGKGGKRVTFPITSEVRAILWPLRGHHPEHVFTYVARRTVKNERIKGLRYPLTYSGVVTQWRRLRAAASIQDFRFHDFRHDFATKLLRGTRNMKLVQKALNHSDIKTTSRYAHVLDDEVTEGIEQVARSRKSQKNSQSRVGGITQSHEGKEENEA